MTVKELSMRSGRLAAAAGVNVQTLRYYERERSWSRSTSGWPTWPGSGTDSYGWCAPSATA